MEISKNIPEIFEKKTDGESFDREVFITHIPEKKFLESLREIINQYHVSQPNEYRIDILLKATFSVEQ